MGIAVGIAVLAGTAERGARVTPTVRVTRVGDTSGPLPSYATDGAAGMDLRAAIAGTVEIGPGGRVTIPTGFAFEIPPGYEGQVRPRSGLALGHGITVANAPGTIDSDFRGQVQVILVNLGSGPYQIEPQSRIAQLVIAPVVRARLEEADALSPTARGTGGFGSTGV